MSTKTLVQNETLGIVLLNMGGPKDLDSVKPFLYNLFADPEIINLPTILKPFQKPLAWLISIFRSPGTRDMYRQIGGGSPILEITRDLCNKIEHELNNQDIPAKSVVAMRYTEPRAIDAMKELEQADVDKIVLFSQYPHYADSTTGSSLNDFYKVLEHSGYSKDDLIVIDEWGTEPEYINWWVNEINKTFNKVQESVSLSEKVHLVFSAHALPQKYIDKGEKYPDRIKEATQRIIAKLEPLSDKITIHQSYQSQAGPIEWTKPYTDELLNEIANSDPDAIIVVPLGFVSNHVETLYELDILYADEVKDKGVENYYRVEVPDADTEYAKNITSMILRLMEEN